MLSKERRAEDSHTPEKLDKEISMPVIAVLGGKQLSSFRRQTGEEETVTNERNTVARQSGAIKFHVK